MKFVKSSHLKAVASIAALTLPKDLNIDDTSKILYPECAYTRYLE